MKIFETIQNKLMILDIHPNESQPFNWKITMGFLTVGSVILSNIILIFSMENVTLVDYAFSFCTSTGLIMMIISLVIITFQRMKLFKVIGSFETITNTSTTYI